MAFVGLVTNTLTKMILEEHVQLTPAMSYNILILMELVQIVISISTRMIQGKHVHQTYVQTHKFCK